MNRIALRYYLKSDHARFKHVAIVKRGRKILAVGWNTGWNHAERDAIGSVKNPELLKGATLYSYRVSKREKLQNAKPCRECSELIRSVGIERVIYSDENGKEQEYNVKED